MAVVNPIKFIRSAIRKRRDKNNTSTSKPTINRAGTIIQGKATTNPKTGKKVLGDSKGKLSAKAINRNIKQSRRTSNRTGNRTRNNTSKKSGGSSSQNNQTQQVKQQVSEVRAVEQKKGLDGLQQRISMERSISRTKQRRGSSGFIEGPKRFGLSALGSGVGLAQFAKAAVTDPKGTAKGTVQAVKEAPKNIKGSGGRIRDDPSSFFGGLAGEALIGVGLSKAPSAIARARARGSSKFIPSKDGTLSGVKIADDVSDIKLVEGVGSTAEDVATQASRAGKEALPVSAARDLFNPLERKKPINKPKPTASSPELERAFFADPGEVSKGGKVTGRLRQSRLGLDDEASLTDILAGDAKLSLRRERSQAIIFPKQKIEKFPGQLSDVEAALKSGKSLSASQAARLESFQLTPSGKFKPVGFVSRESEITLAPGEVIRKKRVAGRTIIQGKPVTLLETEVVQAPKDIVNLANKRRSNIPLTSKELTKLDRFTGISSRQVTGKTIPLSRPLSSSLTFGRRVSRSPFSRSKRSSPFTSVPSFSSPSSSSRLPIRSSRILGSSISKSPITRSPGFSSRALSSLMRSPLSRTPGFNALTRPPVRKRLRLGDTKKKKRKKGSEVSGIPTDKLIFASDFTSRAAGIRKSLSQRDLIKGARESVGIRALPLNNNILSKKSRRKKK